MGKKEEALDYAQKSYNNNPESAKLLTVYSYLLSENNQIDKAIETAKGWVKPNNKAVSPKTTHIPISTLRRNSCVELHWMS